MTERAGTQQDRKAAHEDARALPDDTGFQPGEVFEQSGMPGDRVGARQAGDAAPSRPREAGQLDTLDRYLRGAVSRQTGGVSYWAALQAWEDWAYHMAGSPLRQARLAMETAITGWSLATQAMLPPPLRAAYPAFTAERGDHRFESPAWKRAPYDLFAQTHLAREALWKTATEPLAGVRAHHMRRVCFMGLQMLRAASPSNLAMTNPDVLDTIRASGGQCLRRGAQLYLDDLRTLARDGNLAGRVTHEIGRDIAATPGKVIYRNRLIELIQYSPQTDEVEAEPILIVPAWIMKYYILDLSRHNSLIRYLVEQGFTVFCISWRNPDSDDRDLTLEDYRRDGVMAAIDTVCDAVPGEKIHAVGYCLGGTILSVAAAAMGRDEDERLATMSLLAAQTDFTEAGELMMFTDESQIAALEDLMAVQGYLDAAQMSGAFYYLRANDLVWSRMVERYLKGIDREISDFDAWFTDPTRMPARMHSQYLRWLFEENRLVQGYFEAGGRPVTLKDITMPIFALGAEKDHIAPWRSVHKIGLFAGAETDFILSGGGHNSAVVSPPAKRGAYYRQKTIGDCDDYIGPDAWVDDAPKQPGSWWPAWRDWLRERSSPERAGARTPEASRVICEAPGRYVHQR